MNPPKTLLELSGHNLEPVELSNAVLLLVDMQNEYLDGALSLPDADDAISTACALLATARTAATPIIHVAHSGRPGALFDRTAHNGSFIKNLLPDSNETIVEKGLPNAFTNTNLLQQIKETGRSELLICGFMTHMCVSSTARAALDHGFRVTINADACATRDLPDGKGGILPARSLHEAALVALSDRFAIIARGHEWRE